MNTKATLTELRKSLESAADHALAHAKVKGADRAKVVVSGSIERRLVIESKEFSLANTLESQKVGILVHKDQKKGSANLNNFQSKAISQCVEDAISLAKFSVADEFLTMPSAKEAPKSKTLEFLFDDRLAETSLGELQEFAQSVLISLTKDKRVALDKCDFSISASWRGIYNSLGVAQSETQTALGWSFFGMAVDGEEVSGFDYDGRQSYTFDGALKHALADAETFCAKVISNLRPGKSPSYKGPILLSPRAVEEILLETMLYHAAGSSVMDGKSKWANQIGKKVVSDQINIIDQPHNPMFSGATAYDGDGLPTKNAELFTNGVLNMLHLDCYSAKRIGTQSNAMSGGPFALTLKSGNASLDAMRNSRSELLLVDRFSGNIDPIKGDFSGVAKSSRLIRNGKDAGPVTETMIAGNLFEVLNQVLSISSNQELVSGAALLPWVLVDAVSITGG